MERDVKNAEKQVAMERLQAFALFHKDGMKAVEQSYPEHMQFVIGISLTISSFDCHRVGKMSRAR